jgi:hypothetical protein
MRSAAAPKRPCTDAVESALVDDGSGDCAAERKRPRLEASPLDTVMDDTISDFGGTDCGKHVAALHAADGLWQVELSCYTDAAQGT